MIFAACRWTRFVHRARILLEQRARYPGPHVLLARQGRDGSEILFDSSKNARAFLRTQSSADMLREHERFVRSDLDAQVTAVAAAAFARNVHLFVGHDLRL